MRDAMIDDYTLAHARYLRWAESRPPGFYGSGPVLPGIGLAPLVTSTGSEKGSSPHSPMPAEHQQSMEAQHNNDNNCLAVVEFDFTRGISFLAGI